MGNVWIQVKFYDGGPICNVHKNDRENIPRFSINDVDIQYEENICFIGINIVDLLPFVNRVSDISLVK